MLLLTACLNAEQPLEVDPRQQARIDKILEIKNEAMKLPGMRSENGILGIRVEALIDEIAEATTEEEMRSAEKVATKNIHAKFILWAADRKARPGDYEYFAKEYLNRPRNDEEAMEYFYREDSNALIDPFADNNIPKWPPRDGTWAPHDVSKEDAVEKNRLMMEYSYFMPPTGRDFDHKGTRNNIAKALRMLGTIDRSYVVFSSDWHIWKKLYQTQLEKSPTQEIVLQNQLAIGSLRDIPSVTSFHLLSEGMVPGTIKGAIRYQFENYWELAFTFRDIRDEIFGNHAVWIELAQQEWKKPEQQEFARLLLSISVPKQP